MSHVTDVRLKVADLDALEKAAESLDMRLMKGQKTYKWYGKFMNDSEEGRRYVRERGADSLGKCEHAIQLADHNDGDYEVGVVKSADGVGFELVMDEWGPGKRLLQRLGTKCNRLRQEYACEVATKKAKATLGKKGFTASRENLLNGSVRLKLRRR